MTFFGLIWGLSSFVCFAASNPWLLQSTPRHRQLTGHSQKTADIPLPEHPALLPIRPRPTNTITLTQRGKTDADLAAFLVIPAADIH